MNTSTHASYSRPGALGFSRAILGVLIVAFAAFLSGCASHPAPVVQVEAPPRAKIQFNGIAKDPLDDRSPVNVKNQAVVDEANRVWATRRTDSASYLRAGRLLNSTLQDNEFSTPEEEVRLATMALQHALLANDTETLGTAAQHWEAGYRGIRKTPLGGEVETYLVALRRLGRDLPDELVNIAHPEIQNLLRTEL